MCVAAIAACAEILVQDAAVAQTVLFQRRFVVAALRQALGCLYVVVCIDERLLVEIIICFLIPESGQVLFTKTRKIIDGKIFNDIMDVWLFEYDGEVDLGNATTDEVTQVAWMNREQIKELFDANMFVDTFEYFFTEVDK